MKEYSRGAAVRYAHEWAFARNPAFYDYHNIGGDCTNFVSQCIYAGSGVMNYGKNGGWYYIDGNRKSPSWTGVEFLHSFLTRAAKTPGPFGREAEIGEMRPGDVVQLLFSGAAFSHSLFIVETGAKPSPDNILIATHSMDSDYRPISTYTVRKMRFIRIEGVR